MESETSASPAERYEKRIAYFSEQAKTFDARSRRYSNLRLAIVLLGAASVIVTPKDNAFGVGVLAGFLVLLVILFAIVAFRHQSVEEALSHARAMTNLNAEGTNVLLAKAGRPVCARKFELPSVEVVTSIRAMDSVSDGISLFMAELFSIKVVVEAAHQTAQKGSHPVLYLLDEVLLGTNIDERKIIT